MKRLSTQMNICVSPCGWGLSLPSNIEALLMDTASHMNRLLRAPFTGTIVVVPASSSDPTPRANFRSSPDEPFPIQLTASDSRWAQFAYQFSHEFCHILSDYERLRENPNGWFHEAICELASVFTLRCMAERWSSCAPYPNWVEYSDSLLSYAEDCLSCEDHWLPVDTTLSAWLLAEEETLRKDRYLRDKNATIAYSLLPIFEGDPSGWNSIRKLPDSSESFRDYLHHWHSTVDPVDRPFVNRILNAFE